MPVSVFKPTYTQTIPKTAKIVTKESLQFARFKRRGRTIEAPLTDDGQKIRVETEEWYVRYKDANGKWQRRKGYTDKAATEKLAVEIQQRVDRRQSGVADPFEDHHRRPIMEHVKDFAESLSSKDISVAHRREVVSRVRRVIGECRFERIQDMRASQVQVFLRELRDAGRSARTVNQYLGSIKHFASWLVRDRRTNDDRMSHLPVQNVQADRRHDRRVLMPDEFALLIESAETGPVVEAIAGPDRAMMYILSAWTGYRRKELSSLTPRSFDLHAQTPVIRVKAAYAKNRRTDEIPLHPGVVERLRAWLATKGEIPPDEPLFRLRTAGGCWRKTSKMMRKDLERAGLAYIDEDGLYADFHSHRHGFITSLGKADVSLTTAQKLARHGDPKLTSNVYTHLEIHDKASAIESLPAPPGGDKGFQSEAARSAMSLQATGTDDAAPSAAAEAPAHERLSRACQKRRTTGQLGAPCGRERRESGETGALSQVVKMEGFNTKGQ